MSKATLRTPIPDLHCDRPTNNDAIAEVFPQTGGNHRHIGEDDTCTATLRPGKSGAKPYGEPYTFHSSGGGPPRKDEATGREWMSVPVNAPGIIRYAEARLADGDAKAPMAAMRILAAWPDCPARIAIAFAEHKVSITYHDDRVVVQEVR